MRSDGRKTEASLDLLDGEVSVTFTARWQVVERVVTPRYGVRFVTVLRLHALTDIVGAQLSVRA